MTKIPQDVYYRCVWLVKGRQRLLELTELGGAASQDVIPSAASTTGSVIVSEDVINQAEKDLACIRNALDRIPGAYREGIILNISDKKPFGDMAHPNTWKKWKQEFIYQLAKELHLI